MIYAFVAALLPASVTASTIGQRAGRVVDDAYLYAAVRAKLVGVDPDSASNVRVQVNHGVVTISGIARSYGERTAYRNAAASVAGVRYVRDRIGINPRLRGITERGRDAALEVRVTAAILSEVGRNVFDVNVTARSGVVVLRGDVRNPAVARLVVNTAQSVSGVRRVIDELTIRR